MRVRNSLLSFFPDSGFILPEYTFIQFFKEEFTRSKLSFYISKMPLFLTLTNSLLVDRYQFLKPFILDIYLKECSIIFYPMILVKNIYDAHLKTDPLFMAV